MAMWKVIEDRLFLVVLFILSFLALIPLFLIVVTICKNGLGVISWHFLVGLPKPSGEMGAGIFNAISGTLLLLLIASFIAVPFGVMVGIFLSECGGKVVSIVRILTNVLNGIPSIVIGIVTYLLIVRPMHRFSAMAGGIALAIMMLPMVIRSTEESIKMVPDYLREAAFGLGANYIVVIFRIVLPMAFGGICSGILLGILRIMGESAPLLFTAFGNPYLNLNPFKPVDALPLVIFNYSMSPYEDWHRIAWGASFVLLGLVLVLNLLVRIGRRKWRM